MNKYCKGGKKKNLDQSFISELKTIYLSNKSKP